MKSFLEDKDRNVIPRWRDFKTTGLVGELAPAGSADRQFTGSAESLADKRRAFGEHRTPAFASDLLGAAIVLGKEAELQDAAEFLARAPLAAPISRALAASLLIGKGEEAIGLLASDQLAFDLTAMWHRVGVLRRRVRRDLRSSLAWNDLALGYATLGLLPRSLEAMKVALGLAKENRFVLRSAVRLFVHAGDLDRAHAAARDSDMVTSDPWILAAEIAAANAAGRTSRLVRIARQYLESRNLAPFHLSELASALATLELGSGNSKTARRLFRAALEDPTENSVAQVGWASRRMSGIALGDRDLQVARSFEARASRAFSHAEWEVAFREAVLWLEDQPFSSRPAILGSYVAGVALDDQKRSEAVARHGLVANPTDFSLLNNLAIALARQGRAVEAEEVFLRIDKDRLSKEEEIVWTASRGLLEFRQARFQRGEASYMEAISKAAGVADTRYLARAAVFLAGELIRAGRTGAAEAETFAEEKLKGLPESERAVLLNVLSHAQEARRLDSE